MKRNNFETPEQFELEQPEVPSNGERDAVLTISKLSFKEGTKWSFFEDGAFLSADIEDSEFFEKVHNRKIRFADGDRLSVRLRWKVEVKGSRLIPENTIVKVKRVLTRAKQMRLDGKKDDDQ